MPYIFLKNFEKSLDRVSNEHYNKTIKKKEKGEQSMEKEIFRAKGENFQDLLDYRKIIKGKIGGGCTTIRRDFGTDEYVLVYSDKSFGSRIIEGAIRMSELMADFENCIKEESRA